LSLEFAACFGVCRKPQGWFCIFLSVRVLFAKLSAQLFSSGLSFSFHVCLFK
jgi:hypothetical protein